MEAFPQQGKAQPPDWRSWSGEAELLAQVVESLSQLIKDGDPKHRRHRTVPRPVTEVHRAYERSEDRQDDAFETDVLAALGVGSVV